MFTFLFSFTLSCFFQVPIIETIKTNTQKIEIDTIIQSIELHLVNRENLIPIENADVVIFSESNGFNVLRGDNRGVLVFNAHNTFDSITISVYRSGYLPIKTRIPNRSGVWRLHIPKLNSNLCSRGDLKFFPNITKIEDLIYSEIPHYRGIIHYDGFPFSTFPPQNDFESSATARQSNWPQNSIRILNNPTIKDFYQDYPLQNQLKTISILLSTQK